MLTGAGVSAESGLGTFRGADGLWNRVNVEDYATPEAFHRRPAEVWRWYAERWRRMQAAAPNAGHQALVRWEGLFPSYLLVTQNIDGLHQRAGSRAVVELHGTLRRARCVSCGASVEMHIALTLPGEPPRCSGGEACGGFLRPDVVWFGEMLPAGAMERAVESAEAGDVFLVAGTSGTVFPAAGLIEVARRAGALVIEVNPEETAMSGLAHLRFAEPAGAALPRLTEEILEWRNRSRG